MDIAVYAAQAALLSPLVVAITAAINQAVELPTRYKPVLALLCGMLLGVLLALSQSQPVVNGVWVGAIAGLVGTGLYTVGRAREEVA